jgi:hypothetical protein
MSDRLLAPRITGIRELVFFVEEQGNLTFVGLEVKERWP